MPKLYTTVTFNCYICIFFFSFYANIVNSKCKCIMKVKWSEVTQHIARLLAAKCCTRLATLLRHVGYRWVKFENSQIFHVTFVGVAWHFTRLARCVQHRCARACVLDRFATRGNTVAKRVRHQCCVQQCCHMPVASNRNVMIVWPVLENAEPIMLRNEALKCCDCLTRV